MKSLSILLIDGNEIEREKFQKVCEEVNFLCDVLEATSGEQALSYLNGFENTVNVIILDLHMPQMNGLHFLEHSLFYGILILQYEIKLRQ